MIEPGHGNLLTARVEALVNPVNTVGVMGKGLALQFARAFPDVVAPYQAACRSRALRPGAVHVVERGDLVAPRFIIHFPTKRHWRDESRLADIEAGLVDLVEVVRACDIHSIAIPALGCGLGGLDWGDVRALIETASASMPDVRVVLFGPEVAGR